MATVNNKGRAQLLSQRSTYRNAFIYGFPLDPNVVHSRATEHSPVSPDLVGLDRELEELHIVANWFGELQGRSESLSESFDFYVRYSRTQAKTFLVLVKCTKPDDTFLPHPEELKKLKDFLANEGFVEEPNWFRF